METEEVFVTPVGHKLFFSGGDGGSGHQGVGVAIHKRLLHQIDSISFSAFFQQSLPIAIELGHNMLQMHCCIFSDKLAFRG